MTASLNILFCPLPSALRDNFECLRTLHTFASRTSQNLPKSAINANARKASV